MKKISSPANVDWLNPEKALTTQFKANYFSARIFELKLYSASLPGGALQVAVWIFKIDQKLVEIRSKTPDTSSLPKNWRSQTRARPKLVAKPCLPMYHHPKDENY